MRRRTAHQHAPVVDALVAEFRELNRAEAVTAPEVQANPIAWASRLWSVQDRAAMAGLSLEDLELLVMADGAD